MSGRVRRQSSGSVRPPSRWRCALRASGRAPRRTLCGPLSHILDQKRPGSSPGGAIRKPRRCLDSGAAGVFVAGRLACGVLAVRALACVAGAGSVASPPALIKKSMTVHALRADGDGLAIRWHVALDADLPAVAARRRCSVRRMRKTRRVSCVRRTLRRTACPLRSEPSSRLSPGTPITCNECTVTQTIEALGRAHHECLRVSVPQNSSAA